MDTRKRQNFLTDIIESDLAEGKNGGQVVTRFPPEPNGFLHIGHSKSILLNFGLAAQFGGKAHLRFDDTNPTTEDTAYVQSIQEDAAWLGARWDQNLFFASDYFPRMYEAAVRLVKEGHAFVDTQGVEAIREQRGTFEQPGVNSPHRSRSVAENLTLFEQMRKGELADGAAVLRAKIDMASPNLLMRDPLLYRIRHAHHHRTGNTWPIYPMYDFAHPLEDAFEGVTHSICTLEFESNRELYDWVLDHLGPWSPRPRQYEFARLALGYTVMSKRKLLQLVNEKRVNGWDDPRMPTLAGLRRRGVTAEALQTFAELIGVAKNNSVVDIGKFEFAIRGDLEAKAPRALAVLNPLPVTISNWPAGKEETLDLPWWPGELARGGSREVPFGAELLIEREDFSESPPADWRRLAPGREVRLVGAFVVKCEQVIKGRDGEIERLVCSYDPDSRGGDPADKRKIGGTLHWVHASRSVPADVRLYDRLFNVELPDAEEDFLKCLNPESLSRAAGARVEPAVAAAAPGTRYQFLRLGYFFTDPVESKPGHPVLNRIITLKDTWAKPAEKPAEKKPREPARPAGPKKGRTDARDEVRAHTPELRDRLAKYQSELGLGADEADVLSGDLALARFFDAAVAPEKKHAPAVAKWLLNDLLGQVKDGRFDALPFSPLEFSRFIGLVEAGRVTGAAGKTLLARMVAKGGDPEQLVAELGLAKVEDSGAVTAAVAKVLAQHAAEVERYRAGEKKLFGVLMGAVMRETGGAADAGAVRGELTAKLG